MVTTFLENKYTKWYYLIVNSALTRNNAGYSERHHIIPKSLGGSNEQSNIVTLSAREHFVCHLLLTKMTVGGQRRSMCYAAWQMTHNINGKRYIPTSKMYELLKKRLSESYKGVPKSEETKRKLSLAHKGKPGTPHTEEHKQYMSRLYKGKPKNYASFLGKKHTSETKAKQSEIKRGENNPMFGRMQSEETINRIKQAQINVPKPKFTCNCCGKIVGGKSNFLRWHGDNCKEKQNYQKT